MASKNRLIDRYQMLAIFSAINHLEENHEMLMKANLENMRRVFKRLCEEERSLREIEHKSITSALNLNELKPNKEKLKRQIDYLTEMSR